MKRFLLALIIVLCCTPAFAGWVKSNSNNGWLWLNSQGISDGFLYRQFRTKSGWQTRAVGRMYGGGQQQYGQQQQQYGGGGSWRSKLLSLAAKQAEHQQYLEAIQALGLGGGGGQVQSPYAGSGYGVNISDLPLQQGNTIYGNTNTTYNSLADPFRALDLGAAASKLLQLPEKMAESTERIAGGMAATTRDLAETYRLHRETELRAQIIREVMPQVIAEMNKMMKANSVLRVDPIKDQRPVLPLKADGADGFVKLATVIKDRCLNCHGGPATGSGSEKLLFGQEGQFEPDRLSEQQWAKILKRVGDGTMPPGGALPESEKALFDLMKGR